VSLFSSILLICPIFQFILHPDKMGDIKKGQNEFGLINRVAQEHIENMRVSLAGCFYFHLNISDEC